MEKSQQQRLSQQIKNLTETDSSSMNWKDVNTTSEIIDKLLEFKKDDEQLDSEVSKTDTQILGPKFYRRMICSTNV